MTALVEDLVVKLLSSELYRYVDMYIISARGNSEISSSGESPQLSTGGSEIWTGCGGTQVKPLGPEENKNQPRFEDPAGSLSRILMSCSFESFIIHRETYLHLIAIQIIQ